MKQASNSISEKILSLAKNIIEKQKNIKDKLKTISEEKSIVNNSLTLDEMINRMAITGSCETIKGIADGLSKSASNVSRMETKQFRIYLNSIITICAIAEEAIDRLETNIKEDDQAISQTNSNTKIKN